jgi:hypothetical protein
LTTRTRAPTQNWEAIVEEDDRLDTAEQADAEALAKLRYDNTIGINPDARQPGFAAYARKTHKKEGIIRQYARAYESFLSATESARRRGFRHFLWQAKSSEDTVAAIEVVAEKHGLAPETVRGNRFYKEEVALVKDEAAAAAEESGRSVKEEAINFVREESSRAAHDRARFRDVFDVDRADRPEWLELASSMTNAKDHLRNIVRILRNVKQDGDELSPEYSEGVTRFADTCDDLVGWIRAYQRGDDVADEAAKFLQAQG